MIYNIKFSDSTIQTCNCKIGTGIFEGNNYMRQITRKTAVEYGGRLYND